MFYNAGYHPNPNHLIRDAYLPQSDWLVAVDIDGFIVGVCRQITYTPWLFPTLVDFKLYRRWQREELPKLVLPRVVEVSALAVMGSRASETSTIALGMYRFMWQEAMRQRREQSHWLAATDARVYRVLTDLYHFNFTGIGYPKMYKGSRTVPAILDLVSVYWHLHTYYPEMLEYFVSGLDEPLLPQDRRTEVRRGPNKRPPTPLRQASRGDSA